MGFQCFDLHKAESVKIIASVFNTAGTSKNKLRCRLEDLCAYLIRIFVLLLCRLIFHTDVKHNNTFLKQSLWKVLSPKNPVSF